MSALDVVVVLLAFVAGGFTTAWVLALAVVLASRRAR